MNAQLSTAREAWPRFTLIVPFYLNSEMLKKQIAEWEEYPSRIEIVVVDDGSPYPAYDIIKWGTSDNLRDRLKLYRVKTDIPWNRGGARNLGTQMADTDWIVHVDIDHIMPASTAAAMIDLVPKRGCWYRFPRWRVGAADETRNKDLLPRECKFGRIKEHIDSYLVERDSYWSVGGYDEAYSGCLGGGSPFLQSLERRLGVPGVLPERMCLHVHTRDSVPDASDLSLSRDTSEYSRRRKAKEAAGDTFPKNPIRFEWERQL